jgi:hypothetical protein
MLVEISNGDLIDKISILEIKLDKFRDDSIKFHNVQKEYNILVDCLDKIPFSLDYTDYKELKKINEILWETEENVRKEKEFVKKAYFSEIIHTMNDKRHVIKRYINEITKSNIIEEKRY